MSEAPKSMLPNSSSDLLKALDLLEERLFGLPVDVIGKDPAKVPEDMLDLLAWEYSVDVWDRSWPVETRRMVVDRALEVHQFKGTPFAVKAAIEAFDYEVELVEWFETSGMAPGTFDVTAWLSGGGGGWHGGVIDDRARSVLNRVLQTTAPVSRGYSARLGRRYQQDVFVAQVVQSRTTQVIPVEFPQISHPIYLAVLVHTASIQTIEAHPDDWL